MTSDQINRLRNGRKLRVSIISDCILDIFRYGKIERLSPEFPVPILLENYDEPIFRPGGGANVASQLVHMNADVTLYGMADKECLEHISGFGFKTNRMVELTKGRVPRKVRLFAKNHPILRMDRENENCGVECLEKERTEVYSRLVHDMKDGFDVIILSNYNKGLFTKELASKVISTANSQGIKTVVDPKHHPEWWKGCTIFKPNFSEAKSMCPGLNTEDMMNCLLERSGAMSCVITREADGVLVGSDNGIRTYSSVRTSTSSDVSSVIGAGDCFAALLAYAIGHGLPAFDSCGFAFEGASEYVKARHNRPVSFYEIHRRIEPQKAKIVTPNELEYLRKKVFPEKTWVMTNGAFDCLHKGHIESIKHARDLGHKLVVAVNTDESIKRLKGEERPVFTLEDRCCMLSALEDVDFVVTFPEQGGEDTPYSLINKINPDVVAKGQDYLNKTITGDGFSGKVVYLPMVNGYSTTETIKRIRTK